MGFIDNDEVVVAPVNAVEGQAYNRITSFPRQIGMEKNIVPQAVFGQRVVD
jgi:hypothetical protein